MSRLVTLILLVALGGSASAAEQGAFDRFFTPEQLRIDLYHTGSSGTEIVSVDEILREPYWGGTRTNLIDTLNLGSYLLRVFDLGTNEMIYSRGFCNVFQEWKTTDEALAGVARTMAESLVMPFPKAPVQVRIEQRDRKNVFRPLFELVVDPNDYHINTERRCRSLRVRELLDNGAPEKKVDLVILAEGYRRDQAHKLRKDADRFLEVLFDTEPYKSRKSDFNVRLVEAFSEERGADEPREGKYRDTALDLTWNFFDIPRYMLTISNGAMRDMASRVPYDAIMIIVNSQRYGGGGVFNSYACGSSDNEFSGYVWTHEFGHAFAGLGDEYYSSEVAYNDIYPKGMEPWEPNITALLDTTRVKWGDLLRPGTPIPTPNDSLYDGVVGCFEGAGYSAKGLFRPTRDCRMLSKKLIPFCPVCRRAIERMIDFQTR